MAVCVYQVCNKIDKCLTLGACARVTVVILCVYLSVCYHATVAALYFIYTSKTRCIRLFVAILTNETCGFH